MIFLELVLENFGPYFGRQVINLRPEAEDNLRPIILFGGMNGGGKTTLMDALRLALYGQRAQCSTRGNLGYSEFLTQSVNRNTPPNEKTRIELAFEHIQNDQQVEYRILRTWTKNPKDGKDHLGILDGDWPDVALANTWDEYIENLLPIGISNLFLFDGEQVKELAELETPPPPVVEAIQSLLGLELAERLSVDLEILVSRKRKALADAKQLANIEEIEQQLQQYKTEHEAAYQELASLQSYLTKAHKEQRQAADKFISEGGKIAGERSQLERQLEDYRANLQQVRENLIELASGTLPLTLIQPLLTQAQVQGATETSSSQAKIALEVLRERDQRLLDCLNKLTLPSKKLDKIKDFLGQENQTLEQEAANSEQSWLAADTETLNYLNHLLDHHQLTQSKQAKEQLIRLQEIEQDINATERQIAVAASPEVYQKLENDLREAQTQLAKSQAAYEAKKRHHDQLKDAIEKTKKDLARYGEQNIDRQNDEHIITASAKVQQTLKLFREKLTLRKLNQLESVVTECFLYLLHKSDLVHRVAIDTHSFSLSLYDFQGQPVPKHRLSAGEKQLLAIAFLWGLARVSGRQLPVAIDTPLGRLDSSHRTNLVERYFPAASHQVILLSTDTEIGKLEVERLREADAIAREYLLRYDSSKRQTTTELGYFW
ncbi:DNA sulfur modification protein DndD [Lyngbya aestuarii]|uniref:DNA sulfur modification protein DndD n=1 Tax=Lyngbya aestuarii TaxID=118322 RepID=UPI00403DF247